MGKTLVVVGSGPVGMVSALLLRNQFERVVVLERLTQERFLRTRGFTFPIVLSPAAIRVLEQIDAWDAISSERSPYFGVVVHMRLLGREVTWTAKRRDVYSHWRHHIITSLYHRLLDEGIEVHFEANVEKIDFSGNVCTEATLGEIPFDLLLGADGTNSITRRLMAEVHPRHDPGEFDTSLLDRWYAYRLPSAGALAKRYDGGRSHHAAHIYVDNLPDFPNDKFRLITVSMQQPQQEISVVIKHGVDTDLDRIRKMNDVVMGPLVDAAVLDEAWSDGVAGTYQHVHTPTFHLDSVLLVGDAAHGLEGNGDLINLGISSVGSIPRLLDEHDDIRSALAGYDATVGRALRDYSAFGMRRSQEKIDLEVAAFEVGALLRLNKRHPSMWGIYEDDFEIQAYMEAYRRDLRRIRTRLAALTSLATAGAIMLGARRREPED